jgi:hypothetical protein
MVCYEMEKYKNCLVVFTEARQFHMIKLQFKAYAMVDENPEELSVSKLQMLEVEGHELVMKYPSKHLAHTLI